MSNNTIDGKKYNNSQKNNNNTNNMSSRRLRSTKATQQQSISNYTQLTAAQKREKEKNQEGKKNSMNVQEAKEWEKEYQHQGRLLDSSDEEQLDHVVHNTKYDDKSNTKGPKDQQDLKELDDLVDKDNQSQISSQKNCNESPTREGSTAAVAQQDQQNQHSEETEAADPNDNIPNPRPGSLSNSDHATKRSRHLPEETTNQETTGSDSEDNSAVPPNGYKKINSHSINRRECRRLRDDDSDDTPDRGNSGRRTTLYSTRVTYKVTIAASEDSCKAFSLLVKRLLNELHQSEEEIVILPWKYTDRFMPYIVNSESVPESITKMRKYFDKVYLPKNGESATVYTSFHMGHNSPFDDIREDMQTWLRNNDQGLYYQMLQVEHAKTIGWLLYSTREMDAGALADEIGEMIGTPVGLQWTTVNTGTRTIAEANKAKALSIEVSNQNRWISQRK